MNQVERVARALCLELGRRGDTEAVERNRVEGQWFGYVTMANDVIKALDIATPSARITGDKGRENPAEGAPYGEGLIGRIDALSNECQRLRTALQYIEDLAYVDHQSGNQNFECLQGVAREAIVPRPMIEVAGRSIDATLQLRPELAGMTYAEIAEWEKKHNRSALAKENDRGE